MGVKKEDKKDKPNKTKRVGQGARKTQYDATTSADTADAMHTIRETTEMRWR